MEKEVSWWASLVCFKVEKPRCCPSVSRYVLPSPLFLLSLCVCLCVCARVHAFCQTLFHFQISVEELPGPLSWLTACLCAWVCMDTGMFSFPFSSVGQSRLFFMTLFPFSFPPCGWWPVFFFTHTLTDSDAANNTHPQTHLQVCSGCLSVSLQFVAVSNIKQLKTNSCRLCFCELTMFPLKYLVFIL